MRYNHSSASGRNGGRSYVADRSATKARTRATCFRATARRKRCKSPPVTFKISKSDSILDQLVQLSIRLVAKAIDARQGNACRRHSASRAVKPYAVNVAVVEVEIFNIIVIIRGANDMRGPMHMATYQPLMPISINRIVDQSECPNF